MTCGGEAAGMGLGQHLQTFSDLAVYTNDCFLLTSPTIPPSHVLTVLWENVTFPVWFPICVFIQLGLIFLSLTS